MICQILNNYRSRPARLPAQRDVLAALGLLEKQPLQTLIPTLHKLIELRRLTQRVLPKQNLVNGAKATNRHLPESVHSVFSKMPFQTLALHRLKHHSKNQRTSFNNTPPLIGLELNHFLLLIPFRFDFPAISRPSLEHKCPDRDLSPTPMAKTSSLHMLGKENPQMDMRQQAEAHRNGRLFCFPHNLRLILISGQALLPPMLFRIRCTLILHITLYTFHT